MIHGKQQTVKNVFIKALRLYHGHSQKQLIFIPVLALYSSHFLIFHKKRTIWYVLQPVVIVTAEPTPTSTAEAKESDIFADFLERLNRALVQRESSCLGAHSVQSIKRSLF